MNQQPQEQELTLTLPASRVEYIANVLAQRPWGEVAALLAEIQQQLQAQQQARDGGISPITTRPNGADVAHS